MERVRGISDKKILLIDDEKEILQLLETVLQKEGFNNIYKSESGLEGIEICRQKEPDIVVLDIMLPDIDGFEVCRRLREFTYVPVIFLSAKSDDTDKLIGLGIGGDDYVTKPFSPKEVAFRIKARFRREQYPVKDGAKGEEKIILGNVVIDKRKMEVTKSKHPVSLTAKEYQLLLYLAENANQILSKKRIYQQVWGEDYYGDDNSIMVHIRHLREKIEDNPSNPKYIKTVKGLGYKLAAKDE